MTLIEHASCTISSLNNKGLGVGHTSYGIVELPYVLPEEIVEFERHKYRGQSNVILKNIVLPSQGRSKPVCEYFGACGGCALQHLNERNYVEFKTNLIKELIDKEGIKTTLEPVISIPFGNRRRANFKVVKKNDQVYLGLNRFHSHQIINIDKCPAIVENLSNLIIILKELCYNILNDKQKAELSLSQADNGSHILLEIKEPVSLTFTKLQELEKIAKNYKIIKITFKVNEVKQTIFQMEEPYVKFGDQQVKVDADSFLQASVDSEIALTNIVLKFFLDKEHDTSPSLIDLFCGSGTFTLPLSKCFNVTGFEVNDEAISALNQAIESNNLTIKIQLRNLFATPVNKNDLRNYDYALINPPRIGAKEQCIELAFSNIEKIAYISCNPESFIRDTKILLKGGYELLSVIPLDQFPFTTHLEVVGLFKKANTLK